MEEISFVEWVGYGGAFGSARQQGSKVGLVTLSASSLSVPLPAEARYLLLGSSPWNSHCVQIFEISKRKIQNTSKVSKY